VSALLDADEHMGGGTYHQEAADTIVQLQAQVATRNVAMNTLAKECDALQAGLAAARALLDEYVTWAEDGGRLIGANKTTLFRLGGCWSDRHWRRPCAITKVDKA
jgi:hypothetical protein